MVPSSRDESATPKGMRATNVTGRTERSGGLLHSSRSDPVKFFAWLKAHGFAGRNVHFLAGTGIAADAGFTGLNAENAELTEFDTLATAKSLLERFENRFDRLLGLRAADKRLGDNSIHNIQLDHTRLRFPWANARGRGAGCQGGRG